MKQYFCKRSSNYLDIQIQNSLIVAVKESRRHLKKLGINGAIVATPGHSDDSMSLVLDEGMAFIGDLTPLSLGDEKVKQSWEKLKELGVNTFYAGHG